ncbi:MAG: FctA domain-containing protein [Clostridia bacterium]|nr:FctA domain-containing protein [Clostridia bacterium]
MCSTQRFLACIAIAIMALGVAGFARGEDAVTVRIPIENRIRGVSDGDDTPVFTFRISAVNAGPMPYSREVRISGAGNGKFGPIRFTQPGEYHYEIRELSGSAEGYIYDSTVYNVVVRVSVNASGALYAVVYMSADGSESKVDSALFINRYRNRVEIPKTGYGDESGLMEFIAAFAVILIILLACKKREAWM